MANLDLDIIEKEGETHTTLRMKWYETVVFHNWETTSLNITIHPEKGKTLPVLCEGDTEVKEKIIVVKPMSGRNFTICKAYDGNYFKYTAQFGTNSVPSDPIIIIEK